MGYISTKAAPLRDELENERAASDPLIRVMFRAKAHRAKIAKMQENVRSIRLKMTLTKGSDAARSFSTSSSRSDILLLSEM